MAEIRLGLVGWPLVKSLSPAIHAAFLAEAGLAGSYTALPVEPARLGAELSRLLEEGFTGLNVTFPHKSAASRYCISLDADAEGTGAVNTLSAADGGWAGGNTDVEGFARAFRGSGFSPPLLIVGSGGAGRAAARAAVLMGADHVSFGRTPGPGVAGLDGLAEEIRRGGRGTIVNATTLGWRDDDPFPAPDRLPEGFSFMDLNYNPGWRYRGTLARNGARVATGERMLVAQATLSFRRWTGVAVPEEAALAAIGLACAGGPGPAIPERCGDVRSRTR